LTVLSGRSDPAVIPIGRFVGDDAQAVTAFAAESVNQAPRFFMVRPLASHPRSLSTDHMAFPGHSSSTKCGRMPALRLAAFEFRLSFLEESFHAFVLVFARKAEREQIDFTAQAFVKIRSRRQLDRLFRQPQRIGLFSAMRFAILHRLCLQVDRRHDMVHQPDAQRGIGVDDSRR
jgi:hypothetical protein